MDLWSNKNRLIPKHSKLGLSVLDRFCSPMKHFGSTIMLKVKILFAIKYNFAFILLFLSHLFTKIIGRHAIQ